ncbi:vWA domain-containing protein [Tsukamurella soli]|uniref:Ca-activated chloride channel family protein n=1 Tax=Tsukamurella soli TaxID=644556 RepID=A0ABP8JUC0_9ACTN
MTFQPIVPAWLLVAFAVAVIALRMLTLYRMLVRTGSGHYRRLVLRWSGLTVAFLLVVVAAAMPGLTPRETAGADQPQVRSTANLNVFLVVDRSVDVRVADLGAGATRLSAMRTDMDELIDQFPHARFAVVGFASTAHLEWPLSDDVWSLHPMVKGLSSYTDVPLDAPYEVDDGAPQQVLRDQLRRARSDYPRSKNVVFYLGAGGGGSHAAQTTLTGLAGMIDGGAVLGYGTSSGGAIPETYVDGQLVYFADQSTRRPIISRIDQSRLADVGRVLGVPYFHRDEDAPIAAVVPGVTADPGPDEDASTGSGVVVRTELYWLFAASAAVLVLVESVLTVRDFRRGRLVRREAGL